MRSMGRQVVHILEILKDLLFSGEPLLQQVIHVFQSPHSKLGKSGSSLHI
jgi:hypothetical protein